MSATLSVSDYGVYAGTAQEPHSGDVFFCHTRFCHLRSGAGGGAGRGAPPPARVRIRVVARGRARRPAGGL
ncbi:hypothetical protein, partial [Streptomyces cuspidosporus]|uniref:hypothetical protein n=1 Tax=Streptomyces cuspidosporus TaxID=66882 RepID=UPI0031FC4C24